MSIMRARTAVITAGLVAALPLAAATPAGASGSADAQSAAAAPVWVAGTSGQTFREMVLDSVGNDSAKINAGVSMVKSLTATAERGKNPALLGPTRTLSQAKADLTSTSSALQARQSGKAPATPLKTTYTRPNVASAVPSYYEQRGSAINSRYSWTFNEEIVGGFCAGSCSITDRITQRWTLDPGRTGDRFSFTSNYTPNAGNFYNIFAESDVFCGPQGVSRTSGAFYLCGFTDFPDSSNPRNGIGSGVYSISHEATTGRAVIDGVRLHATARPNNALYLDDAGTGIGKCRTGTDVRCPY